MILHLRISFDPKDPLVTALHMIAGAQCAQAVALRRIADVLTGNEPNPPKATTLGGETTTLPKGAPFPRRQTMQQDLVVTGAHNFDQGDNLHAIEPNGDVDAPPSWTLTANPPENFSLEVEEPGHLRAIVRLNGRGSYSLRAQAIVDDESTEEQETIATVFEEAISHSKAASLGGVTGQVTKGAGFPS